MAFPRWLPISVFVPFAAATFAACSEGASPTTGTASSASSSSTGGTSGVGGAPGTTAVSGTGGAAPDAGPLVCMSHSYSNIKQGSCDLLQQDCPPSYTCRERPGANGIWTSECILTHGLKSEGEKCVSPEECLEKLSCEAGRCTPICCEDSNAPCLGGLCDLVIQLGNKFTKRVCHYAKACELLTEEACEPGFRCHIEAVAQGLSTCIIEAPGPAVPDLGTCSYLNECGDMEHCQPHNGTAQCHFYCVLGQANPFSPPAGLGGCPAGQTCQSVIDGMEVKLGIPTIGLCAPGG